MAALAVTTSAAELDLDGYPEVSEKGQRLRLQNLGAGIVYVGYDDDVTAANGYKMVANAEVEFDLSSGQSVWVIGSAAADLRYIVFG